MKVNLKRSELPGMCQGLKANIQKFRGAKLAYAVAANIRILDMELETMQKAAQADDAFTEYETKRRELCVKHAEKDEAGQPKTENASYLISDQEAFDKGIEELQEEYKEAIANREKELEDFNAFFAELADVQFVKVAQKDLNDDLTGDLVALILPFIK